jgi:hypothetical protein
LVVQNYNTGQKSERFHRPGALKLFHEEPEAGKLHIRLFRHNGSEDGSADAVCATSSDSAHRGKRGEVVMSTSKNLKLTICVGALLAPLLLGSAGANNNNNNNKNNNTYSATFSGFEEIGPLGAGETGAILSKGQGQLTLNVDKGNRLINFQLTYSNLSSPVTVSHIHFGKRHVAGGVMVFFCSNNANPPPGTQTCPMTGGTVTGTITGANVQALAGQNVTAGDFDALLAALESNTAYGNIHTTNFTAGEIRGQILPSKKHD